MLAALKSEFRKLLTVRSTYFITIFAIVLVGLIGGWGMVSDKNLQVYADPNFLNDRVANLLSLVTIFCGIVALLQFSHEYRYNTIMYTLTIVNRRSKILLAKIITLSVFAVVFVLLMVGLSLVALTIGLHIKDITLPAQHLHSGQLLWHSVFTGWGYAVWGLALVALVRNQMFAVVTYLILPMIVEPLLQLLLKDNANYLPYTAMGGVLGHAGKFTDVKAALIFLAWAGGAWIVAWVLFLRRDAN
jgi:ABC-type transport system involved in multi-copper enzyme maturation permease subunit